MVSLCLIKNWLVGASQCIFENDAKGTGEVSAQQCQTGKQYSLDSVSEEVRQTFENTDNAFDQWLNGVGQLFRKFFELVPNHFAKTLEEFTGGFDGFGDSLFDVFSQVCLHKKIKKQNMEK